jgi:hypothetical protein
MWKVWRRSESEHDRLLATPSGAHSSLSRAKVSARYVEQEWNWASSWPSPKHLLSTKLEKIGEEPLMDDPMEVKMHNLLQS